MFAIASGVEEGSFTFPFREVVFDNQTKFTKLKTAHRAGAFGVVFVLAGIADSLLYTSGLVPAILYMVDLLFIYWLIFDPAYALYIGQKWHYIGGTAGIDGKLKNLFGKNAGKIKAAISLIVIIAINLIIIKIF